MWHIISMYIIRLADLASLHLQISTVRNLTDSNKWICFGGSYPGSLSAWFRIKVRTKILNFLGAKINVNIF